jgi:hypothetical protein
MIAQVVCAAQRTAGVPGFDSQQLQIFCWFFDVHGNFAWDCWAGSLGTFFFLSQAAKRFGWHHTTQRRMEFSLPINTVSLSGFGCLLSPSIFCFFLCIVTPRSVRSQRNACCL